MAHLLLKRTCILIISRNTALLKKCVSFKNLILFTTCSLNTPGPGGKMAISVCGVKLWGGEKSLRKSLVCPPALRLHLLCIVKRLEHTHKVIFDFSIFCFYPLFYLLVICIIIVFTGYLCFAFFSEVCYHYVYYYKNREEEKDIGKRWRLSV